MVETHPLTQAHIPLTFTRPPQYNLPRATSSVTFLTTCIGYHPAPTMEAAQSFRLAGNTDTIEILCDQVDGQNVIYWEDIKDVFPRVQYVKNGNVAVKKLKDSDPDR